jgi:hypothetical protein
MNLIDDSAIKTKPSSSTLESDEVLVNRLLEWLKVAEGATSESNWRTESKPLPNARQVSTTSASPR